MKVFDSAPRRKPKDGDCDCDDRMVELVHRFRRGEISRLVVVYEEHIGRVFLGVTSFSHDADPDWLELGAETALRLLVKEGRTKEALR